MAAVEPPQARPSKGDQQQAHQLGHPQPSCAEGRLPKQAQRINPQALDPHPAGALSCVYLMAYSSGRVWIEGLRIDPLCLFGEAPFCSGGLRMAQLVSLLLIALGGLGLWWLYGRHRALPDPSGLVRTTGANH